MLDKSRFSTLHTPDMKTLRWWVLSFLTVWSLSASFASAAETEMRFFEMRIYYAAPGKLDDLQTRFRNHTMKLFEKHGISNIGYWTPVTNTENKLVYILAFPSREAREKSWKEFGADPDWQRVVKETEKNGRLVTKVESIYLKPTDFSPVVKPDASGAHVYELRTYTAAEGKLDALLARFRDHTVTLFRKHGMVQFGYWMPTEAKDGAGQKLIYILEHKSIEAAEASFKAFRADPDWVKAKGDSEKDGPLTVKDGVQSVFMQPTDYSPAK